MSTEHVEWSATEVLGQGWEKVKADPVGLILPIFVVTVIQAVPSGVFGGIAAALQENDSPGLAGLVRLVSQIVSLLISAFLTGGMMQLFFKAARGQPYSLGDLFGGGRFFGNMLLTIFLMQLGTLFGLMFCIVPGLILGLGWSLAVPLVVDRDLSAIDALKESWRITTGQKMNLFVFGLLAFVISLGGLMACCIGVFPAAAVIALGQIFIYERLVGTPPPPTPTTF
jgi:uncharacterized membrane protein